MCGNSLCHSSDRQFESVTVVGCLTVNSSGKSIGTSTPSGGAGRSSSGGLLAAHVRHNFKPDEVGLITAVPTYVAGPDEYAHTETVLHAASTADVDGYAWDVAGEPAIRQVGPTERVAGANMAARRRKAAQLRRLLEVQHPDRVTGQRVLVFDDVFTSGHSVNEVARALRGAGATRVDVVVLARTPW
jgi:hypothetical protein